ncbi:MAG: HAD family phosphatase [Bacillota bacterium]
MKLAIFDFDGTIFPFETLPFLFKQWKQQKKSKTRYWKSFFTFMPVYLLYRLKIISSERMREKALTEFATLFKGMKIEEIKDFFERAYRVMKLKADPNLIREIEKCRGEGYCLILISGALKPIIEIAANDLGFEHAVGTELKLVNNIFCFDKPLEYIQGEVKVIRLVKDYADKEIDWEGSCAYADSFSDLSLLELVGNPIAVRPDGELLEVARDRGWKIIGQRQTS